MARFKRSSRFTLLAIALLVALTVGLVVNTSSVVQAQLKSEPLSSKLPTQWEFQTPRSEDPLPDNRQGGATRGDDCIQGNAALVALVPASGGATMAEYPTIYWYMPATSASAAEFVLRDINQQVVYSTRYALAKSAKGVVVDTPKIMSLTLPAYTNLSPLKIGQEYQWSLVLSCNPLDLSGQLFIEGKIKRVQADPTVAELVSKATPQERVALYAKARYWYETLSTLVELQHDRPNNPEVLEAMNKLLTSVGLNTIPQKPVS
jgi:hypothetical protein